MQLSSQSPLGELLDLLLPYVELLAPLFWMGFFGCALVAIFLYRRRFVRPTFVALFFVGLVFFSTIAPVAPKPYVQWHKFSSPQPESVERTTIWLVDAEGNEVPYPSEATLEFSHVQMSVLARAIAGGGLSERRRNAIVRHLLSEAEDYRYTSPSLVRFVRFPPHDVSTKDWRVAHRTQGVEFVGIRVYREIITTSDDGTKITDREKELLVEVVPGNESSAGDPDVLFAPRDVPVTTRLVSASAVRADAPFVGASETF